MADFEYTRWDGSQVFQPQSKDAAFDNLAEYIELHERPAPTT